MLTVEELKARLRADAEAQGEFATLREQFIALMAPESEGAGFVPILLERFAEAFPNFRPASTPEAMFEQLLGGALEFVALVVPWWQNQPSEVAKAGLVVPLSQMPPREIADLLKAHRDGGIDATIAFVRRYYDRLFGCPHFLPRLKEEWRADTYLRRRIDPLRDALDAHAAGLFGASIPALLAQLEGLIADLSEHRGTMKEAKWREHMNALAGKDPFVGELVQLFVGEILAAPFGHGADVSSPLSRHAILHGGDVGYASETNSRTAILLVDYFAFVSRMRGALRAEDERNTATAGPEIETPSGGTSTNTSVENADVAQKAVVGAARARRGRRRRRARPAL